MLTDGLPRVPLAVAPTPVQPLVRLGAHIGLKQLFVKRDDLTGLATGGNKARKLEFLLAAALAGGTDTLLTSGAAQSNQARQTAAAAACAGLDCVLVLTRPADDRGPQGNWLLDQVLGAEIRWVDDMAALPGAVDAAAAELRARGRRPWVIPYGASNGLGALGYVAAMEEIAADGAFDHIVVASSSGGTQAGLALGARLLAAPGRVLGISVDEPVHGLRSTVARLANDAAELLGRDTRLAPGDIHVNADYLGDGYGVVGDRERDAIRVAARFEGLLLDPVYTGRAFGGLLDLVARGEIGAHDRVLFIHTGGIPALFAYARELTQV
jgi:D-cysteine desulfhydrase family pyridoxal phosphate-dependent enzyme